MFRTRDTNSDPAGTEVIQACQALQLNPKSSSQNRQKVPHLQSKIETETIKKKQIAKTHDKCLAQPAPTGLTSIKTSANDKLAAQHAPTKESGTKTYAVIQGTHEPERTVRDLPYYLSGQYKGTCANRLLPGQSACSNWPSIISSAFS